MDNCWQSYNQSLTHWTRQKLENAPESSKDSLIRISSGTWTSASSQKFSSDMKDENTSQLSANVNAPDDAEVKTRSSQQVNYVEDQEKRFQLNCRHNLRSLWLLRRGDEQQQKQQQNLNAEKHALELELRQLKGIIAENVNHSEAHRSTPANVSSLLRINAPTTPQNSVHPEMYNQQQSQLLSQRLLSQPQAQSMTASTKATLCISYYHYRLSHNSKH